MTISIAAYDGLVRHNLDLAKRVRELEETVTRLDNNGVEYGLRAVRAEKRVRELEAMVKELADEVEAQVLADYCDANGQLVHVSYQRKYARDIEPVLRARRLLEKENSDAT